jgi:hypothetical protein
LGQFAKSNDCDITGGNRTRESPRLVCVEDEAILLGLPGDEASHRLTRPRHEGAEVCLASGHLRKGRLGYTVVIGDFCPGCYGNQGNQCQAQRLHIP